MSLKRTALSALQHTGALSLVRLLRRRALVVVTYHGVLPGEDDRDEFLLGNFVAVSAFTWQMAWIARHYTPVSLSDVVRSVDSGRPLPPRAIAVTFDDGFANNFRYAFPILRRYAIPAMFFLATGHLGVRGAQLWTERVKRSIFLTDRSHLPAIVPGQQEVVLGGAAQRADVARTVLAVLKRTPPSLRDHYLAEIERVCGRPPLTTGESDRYDFLSWDDVRTMHRGGMEFGSHTVSHPILSTLNDEELEHELRQSRQAIEEALQHDCVTFAYPNGQVGDFGAREKQTLSATGYRTAFSLLGGINATVDDPFQIDRVNITRGFDSGMFGASLTGVLKMGKAAKAALVKRESR